MERKRGGKEIYQGVWLGEFVERKLVGLGCFLHKLTIMFSSQIVEKTEEENQKKEMDKKMCNVFSSLSTFFISFFFIIPSISVLCFLFLVFLFKRKDEKNERKCFLECLIWWILKRENWWDLGVFSLDPLKWTSLIWRKNWRGEKPQEEKSIFTRWLPSTQPHLFCPFQMLFFLLF